MASLREHLEKALLERLEKEELNEDLLDFRHNEGAEASAVSFEEYLRMRGA